jgi:hypothetical protein
MGRPLLHPTNQAKEALTADRLRETLWSVIRDLQEKRTTPQIANAISAQSREIMSIVRLELKVHQITGSKPPRSLLNMMGYYTPTSVGDDE